MGHARRAPASGRHWRIDGGLGRRWSLRLAPLALAHGLLARPGWALEEPLSRAGRHHWAWTGTLALGAVLAVWLAVQGFLIGFRRPIQYVTAANGVAIVAFVLLPAV